MVPPVIVPAERVKVVLGIVEIFVADERGEVSTGFIATTRVTANASSPPRTRRASRQVSPSAAQPAANGLEITSASYGVEVRNNILDAGAGYAYKIDADSTTSLTSDYNLFYAFGSAKVGSFGGIIYTTLDDWYYNTLADDHSAYGSVTWTRSFN